MKYTTFLLLSALIWTGIFIWWYIEYKETAQLEYNAVWGN